MWTREAHRELTFWSKIQWELLWSPMGYDVLLAGLADAVSAARVGEFSPDVMIIASDASDVAVGGGVFRPRGDSMYDCELFTYHMLDEGLRDESSTLRELDGISDTLVAARPPKGTRVIAVVDNQSTVKVLNKGSSNPMLLRRAQFVFMFCLRHHLILQGLWQRRTTGIVTFCDDGSRLIDACDFSACADLFWGANHIAISLWGCGFTFDRFASSRQVQPVDCPWKLPFNSWHVQAFSEGADALAFRWDNSINWVNAPFGLVGKVYALLRAQRAVAAVVIPRGSSQWWASSFWREAEGVVHRWDLDGSDRRCRMVGSSSAPVPFRKGLAVVFFDFRRHSEQQQTRHWVGLPAERIHGAWQSDGSPAEPCRYFSPSGRSVVGFN